MPYIPKNVRELFDDFVDFEQLEVNNCGELNYILTKVCIAYLAQHGLNYQVCNDIVGALDNTKDEFRRRVQHPYEDKKIRENSDIY